MPLWNGGSLIASGLLANLVLRVDELEYLLRGAERLLEIVIELPELPYRLVEFKHRNDEGDEEALAEVAMLDVLAAEEDEQRDGDGSEDVHHRRVDGEGADGAQIGFEQTPRSLTEAPHLPGLHAEGLHNANAGNGFVQQVMDFGELVLPFASGGADPISNPAGRQDYERHENDQDPGQPAAQSDDHDGGEEEGKKLL